MIIWATLDPNKSSFLSGLKKDNPVSEWPNGHASWSRTLTGAMICDGYMGSHVYPKRGPTILNADHSCYTKGNGMGTPNREPQEYRRNRI